MAATDGISRVPTAASERLPSPASSCPRFNPIRENVEASVLCKLYEERRAEADFLLGPIADRPKPRIRINARRPRTPPSDDTQAWRTAASKLERPAAARLLTELQARLARECEGREEAE